MWVLVVLGTFAGFILGVSVADKFGAGLPKRDSLGRFTKKS